MMKTLKRTKELLEEFDLVEHQLKRVAKFSTGIEKESWIDSSNDA